MYITGNAQVNAIDKVKNRPGLMKNELKNVLMQTQKQAQFHQGFPTALHHHDVCIFLIFHEYFDQTLHTLATTIISYCFAAIF